MPKIPTEKSRVYQRRFMGISEEYLNLTPEEYKHIRNLNIAKYVYKNKTVIDWCRELKIPYKSIVIKLKKGYIFKDICKDYYGIDI